MTDTDWRPSSCPGCGKMRNAGRYPVCTNTGCADRTHPVSENRESKTMKTEQKYLWVKGGERLLIVKDIQVLYRDPKFDFNADRIYELGPEVKLEVNVVPVKTPTRFYDPSNKE